MRKDKKATILIWVEREKIKEIAGRQNGMFTVEKLRGKVRKGDQKEKPVHKEKTTNPRN